MKLLESFHIPCWTVDDSLQHLKAALPGPLDSPYESGVFQIDITIPQR